MQAYREAQRPVYEAQAVVERRVLDTNETEELRAQSKARVEELESQVAKLTDNLQETIGALDHSLEQRLEKLYEDLRSPISDTIRRTARHTHGVHVSKDRLILAYDVQKWRDHQTESDLPFIFSGTQGRELIYVPMHARSGAFGKRYAPITLRSFKRSSMEMVLLTGGIWCGGIGLVVLGVPMYLAAGDAGYNASYAFIPAAIGSLVPLGVHHFRKWRSRRPQLDSERPEDPVAYLQQLRQASDVTDVAIAQIAQEAEQHLAEDLYAKEQRAYEAQIQDLNERRQQILTTLGNAPTDEKHQANL